MQIDIEIIRKIFSNEMRLVMRTRNNPRKVIKLKIILMGILTIYM